MFLKQIIVVIFLFGIINNSFAAQVKEIKKPDFKIIAASLLRSDDFGRQTQLVPLQEQPLQEVLSEMVLSEENGSEDIERHQITPSLLGGKFLVSSKQFSQRGLDTIKAAIEFNNSLCKKAYFELYIRGDNGFQFEKQQEIDCSKGKKTTLVFNFLSRDLNPLAKNYIVTLGHTVNIDGTEDRWATADFQNPLLAINTKTLQVFEVESGTKLAEAWKLAAPNIAPPSNSDSTFLNNREVFYFGKLLK